MRRLLLWLKVSFVTKEQRWLEPGKKVGGRDSGKCGNLVNKYSSASG
jgi:hypothetical protein